MLSGLERRPSRRLAYDIQSLVPGGGLKRCSPPDHWPGDAFRGMDAFEKVFSFGTDKTPGKGMIRVTLNQHLPAVHQKSRSLDNPGYTRILCSFFISFSGNVCRGVMTNCRLLLHFSQPSSICILCSVHLAFFKAS